MNTKRRSFNKMVAASIGGLLAGASIQGGFIAAAQAGDEAGGKHDCKGQNGCKGQGGCKSGDNGCAGKNSCKGKGGCKVPVPEGHQ